MSKRYDRAVKRVVTGVDEEGRSYVVSADELPDSDAVVIWRYQPEDIAQLIAGVPEDVAATMIEPPPGGAVWVAATFHPGPWPPRDAELPELGDAGQIPGMDANGFHTTRTIDFDYLLSGELTLLLDREEVRLQAGDVVLQQATRHAWRNDSSGPAVLLALLHTPSG
jgi:cupin domain